ncbi:MAG: hypothetical protein AB8H47_00680 [Bacteroidia bacterium]
MREKLLSIGLPILLFIVLGVELGELLLASGQKQSEPLWYCLMGLLSVGLILFWPPHTLSFGQRYHQYRPAIRLISLLALGLAGALFLYHFSALLERFPLASTYSDILQNANTHAERIAIGQDPYFKIDRIWNGVYPVYMAGRWLAYVPAILLKIDIRWFDAIWPLLGLGLLWSDISKRGIYANLLLLASLLPLAWIAYYLLEINPWFFRGSGEGLSLGWYLMLAWAMLQRRFNLQGFLIVMLLLGRPSLVLWVPIWMFMLWRYESQQSFYQLLIGLLVSLTVFLIIPFDWEQWDYFINLPQEYLTNAYEYWTVEKRVWFISSPGYAIRFAEGKLGILAWIQFLSIALGSGLVFWIWKKRSAKRAQISLPYAGLLSLKISLLFYAAFHLMPFHHFFVLASFLSLPLIWMLVPVSQSQGSQAFGKAVKIPRLKLNQGQRKNILLLSLLIGLVLLEVLANTRFVAAPFKDNFVWSSAIYFLVGLGIVFVILIKPAASSLPSLLPDSKAKGVGWFKWAIVLSIGFFLLQAGSQILINFPLTIEDADMLPILRTQAQRFINGEDVYAVMPGFWKGNMKPIYMPGFWAPLVPFEAAGIDIRWATLVLLLLALGLILSFLPIIKRNQSLFVLVALLPLVFIYESVWTGQESIIRLSEEGIVMFYYVLLGFAVVRRWPVLTGVAIALCMLSRFGLVPWVGFYLIYVFFFENKRQALITAATAGAVGLFGFLIPYGFELWDYFFNHPHRYQKFAESTWEVNQQFFANTLGLAKYFTKETVRYQHRIHLILSFLAPALLLFTYWRTRLKWQWNEHFFALAMLKLTLVIFYSFIVMPVFYLFFVNTILSCLILFAYLGQMLKSEKP